MGDIFALVGILLDHTQCPLAGAKFVPADGIHLWQRMDISTFPVEAFGKTGRYLLRVLFDPSVVCGAV